MEEQRRVAAGGPLGLVLEPEPPPVPEVPRGPSMTATLAAGPASPPQRPSWWRRILARLRRTS
jgi:hypothetical protein